MPKSASNDPKRNGSLIDTVKDFFKPIEPLGGVGGRQNENIRSQIDEHGNPVTPPPKTVTPPPKKDDE